MRTITHTVSIELSVTKDDLIENKWIPLELLSQKLYQKELEENKAYKTYRNKFYNAIKGDKLNMKTIAGMKCFDVDNPMKATASIKISFKRL